MATGGMAMEVRAERTPRSVSVTLDATRLFLPAYMVQLRFEKALTPRVSVALTGGYGSLPSYGNESRGRASATLIGAEMRGYLLGGFDTTGLFVSAEIVQRNASLFFDEHVSSRTFVQGLTVGPTIGVKMVTFGGFTVESRVGAAYVVDDKRRDDGLAHDKIVPTFGVGLGFTL
jgi:hypothetical protein